MGQVALTAGYYLMSKLEMHEGDPLPAGDLFDMEYIDVKAGLVHAGPVPRGRLFQWKDPRGKRDIIVLIGEAQPPLRKLEFCGRLLDYAERLGVREVYAFAAMATSMQLGQTPRVFGVATQPEDLELLRQRDVEIIAEGQINGLNGIFLAAAAQRHLRGIGLLGEMPAFAAQVPYPRASGAVLQIFSQLSGVSVDLRELDEYGRVMDQRLGTAIETMKAAIDTSPGAADDSDAGEEHEPPAAGPPEPPSPRDFRADRARIEDLFRQAAHDRSKTFELKRELDRTGLFKEYENRFLDLFRKTG
jgi:predicted ATP-grasp superfamily ATP-dependent carboligase